MKKLILIACLYAGLCNAQTIPVAQLQFSTLSDLRAQGGTPNLLSTLNGLNAVGDGNGGVYMWNDASTATDDGFITIKVANITTGRWIRQLNSNTIKAFKTLSGAALQTAYNITYDTPLPAAPALIIIQAYSANAAVPSWVSNVTSTGFTANFSSVPILGTNNITVGYLIIKQ